MPISPTLVFDGNCKFCRRSINWFQTRDSHRALIYIARQSPERAAQFPQLDDPRYEGTIQLVMPDGEIRSGEYAIATVLRYLPNRFWRITGSLITAPIIKPCATIVYKWIAKNRHRFQCKDNSCLPFNGY